MSHKYIYHIPENCQPISRPSSENLATGPRWVWEPTTASAVETMMKEEFVYMSATTAMYSHLSKIDSISFLHKIFKYLVSAGKTCVVVEIGPNLFNGNLVIAWKKNFRYAALINY